MIKKISIFLFIVILFFSCGKKGDPIYIEKSQNSKVFNTQQISL